MPKVKGFYKKFRIHAIVIAFFILLFLILSYRQPVYPEPPHIGSDVVIEVGTLKHEIPQFFTYHYHDKNISFFVVKTGDKVLSFLDACSRCYRHKRGYRFDNGQFVCRKCDVEYSVQEIEKGVGSCYPIKVSGYLQDGRYIIPLSALEKMADKF